MATLCDDLSIDELLADSLVRAVMRADRVDPVALGSLLRSVAGRLETGIEHPAFTAHSWSDASVGLDASVLHRMEASRVDLLGIAPYVGGAVAADARGELCSSCVCW
jgi:hypothetical protein